jgi:hypothetical protein
VGTRESRVGEGEESGSVTIVRFAELARSLLHCTVLYCTQCKLEWGDVSCRKVQVARGQQDSAGQTLRMVLLL